MIRATERVLPRLGVDTEVIPGHGPVSDKVGLQAYHDMLVGIRGAVAKQVKQKQTLEQVPAAKPTAPWDDTWGKGPVKPELIVTVLFNELSRKK